MAQYSLIQDLSLVARLIGHAPEELRGSALALWGRTPGDAIQLLGRQLPGVSLTQFDQTGEPVSESQVNGPDGTGIALGLGTGDDSILIGAPFDSDGGSSAGAAYVIFDPASLPATFDLATLDGTNGFKVIGDAEYDNLGYAASGTGDINGDGFDDWIFGVNNSDNAGDTSGSAYVVFGQSGPFSATIAVTDLDGNNGFRIDAAAAGDALGVSVEKAGDFDGDGFDDLVIGAIGAGNSGEAYVVFGTDQPFAAVEGIGDLDGSNGIKLSGAGFGSRLGMAVASGDINADGLTDIIAGAPGSIQVFFGTDSGDAEIKASDFDGTNGFSLTGGGPKLGYSIAVADVNGDGFDDVIGGDSFASPDGFASGRVYVFFGRASGPNNPVDVTALNGDNGVIINGENGSDYAGKAIAAGDVNGDGFADVFIGAPGYDAVDGADTVSNAGAIYILDTFDDILEPVKRVGTAIGNVIQGSNFNDTISGLGGNDLLNGRGGGDTLNGGYGNDTANAGAGDDTANGSTGNDTLSGGRGRDVLVGGTGKDTLIGGINKDTLTGGTALDKFAFNTLAEIGKGAASDVVTDFNQAQHDKIKLSAIDAVQGGSDQAFSLLATEGAAFTSAGQARFRHIGGDTFVDLNTDANVSTIEATIRLTGTINLLQGDFLA